MLKKNNNPAKKLDSVLFFVLLEALKTPARRSRENLGNAQQTNKRLNLPSCCMVTFLASVFIEISLRTS